MAARHPCQENCCGQAARRVAIIPLLVRPHHKHWMRKMKRLIIIATG